MTQSFDTDALNRDADLLALCGTTLRRLTGGGEYAGPCPRCGGQDRFHVHTVERWWFCRSCHAQRADAIALVAWLDGCDFKTACERLQGGTIIAVRKEHPAMQQAPQMPAPTAPSADWRRAAAQVLDQATATLHSPTGASALAYLAQRGIDQDIADSLELGYVPADTTIAGLKVPAGILIPWRFDGDLWQLKVRRRTTASGPRYLAVAGGHPYVYSPELAWCAAMPRAGRVLVLTEGEFDCALLWAQTAPYLAERICVATLGSASVQRTGPETRLKTALSGFDRVLLALDADTAADGAVRALTSQLPHAVRMRVPQGKDVTAYWQAGGKLREWVEVYLAAPPSQDGDAADRCDVTGCAGTPYLERDPNIGAFCGAHAGRWELLNCGAAYGWPNYIAPNGEHFPNEDAWRFWATSPQADDARLQAALSAFSMPAVA